MCEVMGKMITCHKCKSGLFLEYLGKQDLYGGYDSYSKFEEVPKGWWTTVGLGYLCPKCAPEFLSVVREFFGDNIAPAWRLEEEVKDDEEN